MDYIGIEKISRALNSLIKKDDIAKVVAFLTQFSTYLLDDQLNLIIASLSSTGKTHILLNISRLFPEEDVLVLGYSSPKAFFHELGTLDKNRNKIFINLKRKNLIFLDQPHPELLTKLRPILSHDKKEIEIKITDKNQKGGNITKTVVIQGFPAVSFATTYLKLDEQEITRALIISPDISQEKIEKSIDFIIDEKLNPEWNTLIEKDEELNFLKDRIKAFREISEQLKKVKLVDIDDKEILKMLYKKEKIYSPKDMRNFKKFLILAECFAGLNFVSNRIDEDTLLIRKEDLLEAFKLWKQIGMYQDVGVMPFALDVYYKVILPLSKDGFVITKKVLMRGIKEKFSTSIQLWYLEQQVLPSLEAGGYISIEKNPDDRRQIIIVPLIDIDDSKNEGNLEILDLTL